MSSIYIGSARHDEHGACYSGGAAGDQLQTSSTLDQTGEVSVQTMYTHSSGWYILRPLETALADQTASLMLTACNNVHIGYDQSNRLAIVSDGISSSTDTECDCSSLVREVVKEGSGTDPGNFTTANEATLLESTALFAEKTAYVSQSSTPVYNGDILVTKTKGHTVVVVSGSPRTGSTRTTSLTVDGKIGKLTVSRLQEVLGTTVDGFLDGQLSQYKTNWSALLSSVCTWSGGTSQAVYALQKLVGAAEDGLLGSATAKALQSYLISAGYSCGSTGADGKFGTNSAKALQSWLNAR